MPFDPPKIPQIFAPPPQVQLVAFKKREPINVLDKIVSAPAPQRYSARDNWKPKLWREIKSGCFDYLPIKYMRLPNNGWWQYSNNNGHLTQGYELAFSPFKDKSTQISFSCPELEAGKDSSLRAILNQSEHKLTSQEVAALNAECRVFFSKLHTESLSGKMILVQESSTKSDGYDEYKMVFNYNQDGTEPWMPAEITFRANDENYKKYISAVLASFKTIQWNEKAHMTP